MIVKSFEVVINQWFTGVRDCTMMLVANIQYIPRNMHTVFALLCFVVVIHWLIFPYLSGLLHWHCGNLTIAPVPAKQPWWIWINTSCEFIMNDCITTTKQITTKPFAYFLGYTVFGFTVYLSIRYIYRAYNRTHPCRYCVWDLHQESNRVRRYSELCEVYVHKTHGTDLISIFDHDSHVLYLLVLGRDYSWFMRMHS